MRGAAPAEPGAQRRERVVGEQPGPDEVPQRGDESRVVLGAEGTADGVGERAEEVGAAAGQHVEDRSVQLVPDRPGVEVGVGLGEGQRREVGRVQRHPAVVAGQGTVPRPHDLAGRGQLVEQTRGVAGHPRREHERLQRAGGHDRPGELLDRAEQPVDTAHRRPDALPRGQEAREIAGRHRLDLRAQGGQRAAPDRPEHLGVAPVQALDATGLERPQLALDQPAAGGEPAQRLGDDGGAEPEPGGRPGRRERPVRPRVAGQQVAERVGHGLGERLGHPDGQGGAQRVLEAAGVLDGGPAFAARDPHPDGAPARLERLEPAGGDGERRGLLVVGGDPGAGRDLGRVERTEQAQQVGGALEAAQPALGRQSLELVLGAHERRRVEQVAQRGPFAAPEEFGEQAGVECQGGGPALGERRVTLVEELRDVAEQQAARERRRLLGLDLDEPDGPGLHVAHERHEARHVEHVLEALAHGLEDDREAAVAARHLQQLRRPLPLLPQRLALAGRAPRQQQRACGALAEASGEQGRAAELVGDEVLDVGRVEQDELATSGARPSSVSTSGRRRTSPSSPCIAWTSTPKRSRNRAATASAHGACT